jgi:hypothetical protein
MGEHEKKSIYDFDFFLKRAKTILIVLLILPFLKVVPNGSMHEYLYPFGISKCDR